jgi:hypothetical protein
MYYNPTTDRALQSLEQQAEANRKAIERLNVSGPSNIVWSELEGRWVNKPID